MYVDLYFIINTYESVILLEGLFNVSSEFHCWFVGMMFYNSYRALNLNKLQYCTEFQFPQKHPKNMHVGEHLLVWYFER